MRFIIDTEDDKKRIIDQIVSTPLDQIVLQASVDDKWNLQFYLILFTEGSEIPEPLPKKKKK